MKIKLQGWKFALHKERLLAIQSSRSKKKERPWANRSRGSLKKSDMSDYLKKIRCFHLVFQFSTAFPIFMPKSKSLPSLFAPLLLLKERRERFAHGRST